MRTKQLFKITGVIFLFLGLISCEKVIDLKLKTDEQRIVVEGYITKGETTHQVHITKTLDFDETAAYPPVEDAVVTIVDNEGNAGVFTHTGNGVYEIQGYAAIVGRTYTLKIISEGVTYEAKSTIPSEILLDDIYILTYDLNSIQVKVPIPIYTDIAGEKNYYLFEPSVNGEKKGGIRLLDDEYMDGLSNERPVFISDLEVGDTLKIVMHCIDYSAYKYLFTLDQNTGSVAAPANPESNFGNNALGYFSARETSEKTVIVQ